MLIPAGFKVVSLGVALALLQHVCMAQATVYGGNLTHHQFTMDSVEITLQLISDCDVDPPNSIPLYIQGDGCSFDQTITLNKDVSASNLPIYGMCPQDTAPCAGSTLIPFGFTLWTYKGVTELPAGCTGYQYQVVACCLPGGDSLQLSSWGIATPNSAPKRVEPLAYYGCVGWPLNLNYGTYDPEGDSVKHEGVPLDSLHDLNAQPIPLPSLSIPGDYGIRTLEYRNGNLFSITTSRIKIAERKCYDWPLELSTLGAVNDTFYAVAGQKANMFFETNELSPGQEIESFAWLNKPPNGTWIEYQQNDQIVYRLQWPTTAADVGDHFIGVDLKDNSCPFVRQSTHVYWLRILKPTGINEFSYEPIKVYPNPASEQFQLWLPETLQNASLTIRDMSGRIIYGQPIQKEHTVLNVSTWPMGVYHLMIEGNNGAFRASQRLLVH